MGDEEGWRVELDGWLEPSAELNHAARRAIARTTSPA